MPMTNLTLRKTCGIRALIYSNSSCLQLATVDLFRPTSVFYIKYKNTMALLFCPKINLALTFLTNWLTFVKMYNIIIYPYVFSQKKNFTSLMRQAFPKSKIIIEQVDDVMSFIKSCLTLVPEKRPTMLQMKEHSLFGGQFKNVRLEPNEKIWNSTGKIFLWMTLKILSLYRFLV